MSVEKGLLQKVAQDTGVDTLVNGNVFWTLAPKGQALPYVVFSTVFTKDRYTMKGSIPLREAIFQCDCFDTTAYEAQTLGKAVRDVLKDFKGTLPDSDSTVVDAVFVDKDWDMPYQEGGKSFVHRRMLHFRVHYYE